MNFEEFNFYETNGFEFKEDDFEFRPSFPLFNFEALKEAQYEELPFNLITSQKVSEIIEDIVQKKVKTETNSQGLSKKRGRKAIDKNAKQWDDPRITIQEIIENDLSGIPMKAEIKMREEKLRKMREKKALKKAEREKGTTVEPIPIQDSLITGFESINKENSVSLVPQLIFKDGKIVLDNSLALREERGGQNLTVVEKKPYKLTSMSFRTKNNTAKWTEEETKKFYKAIEIFGADFSMIAKLFPNRNRDQVKNKFRKEEKVNTKIMDEAFRKNTVLGKRSIMDRINTFNNNFTSGNKISIGLELSIEGGTTLERTTSTDSMDLKIMEEIQQIFTNEITPKNNLISPIGQLKDVRMEGRFDVKENAAVQENGTSRQNEIIVEQEKAITGEIVNNKQSFLHRFLV